MSQNLKFKSKLTLFQTSLKTARVVELDILPNPQHHFVNPIKLILGIALRSGTVALTTTEGVID